jgi:hypothetical protein
MRAIVLSSFIAVTFAGALVIAQATSGTSTFDAVYNGPPSQTNGEGFFATNAPVDQTNIQITGSIVHDGVGSQQKTGGGTAMSQFDCEGEIDGILQEHAKWTVQFYLGRMDMDVWVDNHTPDDQTTYESEAFARYTFDGTATQSGVFYRDRPESALTANIQNEVEEHHKAVYLGELESEPFYREFEFEDTLKVEFFYKAEGSGWISTNRPEVTINSAVTSTVVSGLAIAWDVSDDDNPEVIAIYDLN